MRQFGKSTAYLLKLPLLGGHNGELVGLFLVEFALGTSRVRTCIGSGTGVRNTNEPLQVVPRMLEATWLFHSLEWSDTGVSACVCASSGAVSDVPCIEKCGQLRERNGHCSLAVSLGLTLPCSLQTAHGKNAEQSAEGVTDLAAVPCAAKRKRKHCMERDVAPQQVIRPRAV